jgi:hypothetical protein
MKNGNLDLKDMRDSAGGSMHIERERVPAESLGLRDSDWEDARLPRSKSSICDQRKTNSLHLKMS